MQVRLGEQLEEEARRVVEEGPDRAVLAASAQRGRVDRITEAALSGAWPLEVVRVDLVSE